jgi:hypothetical protein
MPELGSGFSDRLLELELFGGFIDFHRPTSVRWKNADRRRSVRIAIVMTGRTRCESDSHGNFSSFVVFGSRSGCKRCTGSAVKDRLEGCPVSPMSGGLTKRDVMFPPFSIRACTKKSSGCSSLFEGLLLNFFHKKCRHGRQRLLPEGGDLQQGKVP